MVTDLDQAKLNLVTNYFAEDWAIEKALLLLEDYQKMMETQPPLLNAQYACVTELELARIWTKVDAIRAKQAAKPKHSPLPQAAPRQEAQEPVWDGKLSDAMQNALAALYLECGPGITGDITHQVQKECEAIYTSYTTTKRMYQAARARLELLEAAQPQPDPFAAPQPAPAPPSDDDVKGVARNQGVNHE